MCVLSLCLNNSMDPTSFTLSGRWFHKLGRPTAKERSPNKTVLEGGGMTRRRCDDDLRHRLDETSTQSFFLPRLVLTHVAPWIRVSIAWNRFFEVRADNAVGHVESAWCPLSKLGHTLFAPQRWELTGYGCVGTLVVRRGWCYNNQLWQ